MKVWIAAVVVIIIIPFRFSNRLFLDDIEQQFESVSETICQLLPDNIYGTLHLVKNIDVAMSDNLISTIAYKYNRPVVIHTGHNGIEDAAIIIINSDSLTSLSIYDLKRISFLLLIVNMVDQMEIVPTIISELRNINIHRITIVSFDSTESAAVNISTLFRHRTINCENSHIYTTSSLSMKDSESFAKNLSTERSHTDFRGCIMDIGIVTMPPFTLIAQNGHELLYSGVEVEMIRVLAEHFNFKIQFIHPPNGTKWGNLHENGSTGLMALIQESKVDFAIGSLARTLARNTLLKGGVGSFYDQIVFGVPPGIPYSPLQQLARPVTTECWMFIIMTCITVSMLFSVDVDEHLCKINLKKCKISLTDVWSILLGGVKLHPPRKVFGRYLLLGWLMVTLVCRTAYQAILFGHLRRGVEFKPILTLQDMFEAGLQYYMYNISQRFFTRSPRIMMRSVIVSDFVSLQNILADIADNKLMVAFPLPKSNIDYFNKQRLFKSKVHINRYIIEKYEVAIHYPLESRLPALFDYMVLRIRAAGLHDCWVRRYRGVIVDNTVEHKKLQLQNLLGAFTIHGILCGLSCIIFLIELKTAKATYFLNMKI
ncbi:uncharacterized protein LOC110679404 [Aedes aegypti]|uniref:Ionotropic glutamate receptor L-glutamate and glycine-binding domain-containing protein n=1 Tax=Aedes aegypti TaxID=7159 RepID=A0A6I8TM65_AEDAE|nr:ionotropic receptor 7n [Aedes aegypti]